MTDADRYIDLRSSWSSSDEAFNWLVAEVTKHGNGEPVDNYCMYLAARDMICSTLREVSGWSDDQAVDFVSEEGALAAEINDDEELGRHLLLAWQPTSAAHAEVFIYALTSTGDEDDSHR